MALGKGLDEILDANEAARSIEILLISPAFRYN
jgi:hypothetical protein